MSHIHCLKNLHQQMENVENLPNLMRLVLLLVQENWLLPCREDWGYNTSLIKDHLFPSPEWLKSHEASGCFHNYFQFLKFPVNRISSVPPMWIDETGLAHCQDTASRLWKWRQTNSSSRRVSGGRRDLQNHKHTVFHREPVQPREGLGANWCHVGSQKAGR